MLGLTQYREMHGDCWNRKRREARIKGSTSWWSMHSPAMRYRFTCLHGRPSKRNGDTLIPVESLPSTSVEGTSIFCR